MVGTRRLELLTSTVSILRDLSFQRLTFSAGAAKSLEGITRTRLLWVKLWVEFRGVTQHGRYQAPSWKCPQACNRTPLKFSRKPVRVWDMWKPPTAQQVG